MARGSGGNTAIGLGIAGVAALFLVSGIQNKKLSQVLEGDIGSEPNEAEKGLAQVETSIEEHGGYPSKQENKTIYEHAKAGEAEIEPGKYAPSPATAGQWTWPSLRRAIKAGKLSPNQVKTIIKHLEGKG